MELDDLYKEAVEKLQKEHPEKVKDIRGVFDVLINQINFISNPPRGADRGEVFSSALALIGQIRSWYIKTYALSVHAMETAVARDKTINYQHYYLFTADGVFVDEIRGGKALVEYIGLPFETIRRNMRRRSLTKGLFINTIKLFTPQEKPQYAHDGCPFERKEFVEKEYLLLKRKEILQDD